MRHITRVFREYQLKVIFYQKTGEEFQKFFSDVMNKKFPSDYISTRPWGNIGDQKNDGYLPSQRILFQLYAPDDMKASDATSKIKEDYSGAIEHWNSEFDTWVFVHNAKKGLGPPIVHALDELRNHASNKNIITWGLEEIRRIIFSLSDADINDLLGPSPTENDFNLLGFEEIQDILDHISEQPAVQEADITPVSQYKIDANGLSEEIKDIIKIGFRKSDLVDKYISKCYDPLQGDRIANSFKTQYIRLKSEECAPDDIFQYLQEFAGGSERKNPRREAAIFAVLAYLFERCDIFEQPEGEIDDSTI